MTVHASFFKAVQVCPWLCKDNISVPMTVQAFLKLYAVQVCPWLCKVSISVPVTVQAFVKLYWCAATLSFYMTRHVNCI